MKFLNRARLNLSSTLAIGACVMTGLVACQAELGADGTEGGVAGEDGDSSETGDGTSAGDDRYDIVVYEDGLAPSPLARLTNEEFMVSASSLLGVSSTTGPLADSRSSLVAEPLIGGLNNDSRTQLLTQLKLGSFSAIASAATDAYLDGVGNLQALATRLECASGAADFSACLKEFGTSLMGRAYRRPLTSEESSAIEGLVDDLDALIADGSDTPNTLDLNVLRVRTLVRFVLTSPDYLLLVEKGAEESSDESSPRPLTSHEIAARMAYFLSGGPPDAELLAAAEAGTLSEADVRLEHAARILDGSGGQEMVERSILAWLGVTESASGPAEVATLTEFIGTWFSEERPFSDFYQAPVDVDHLDGTMTEEPFGVLGLPAFLKSHTAFPTPAFITRGVFVVERLLCLHLPDDLPAEALESGATGDLEVFQVHDQQPCASCHQYFDNFGASLHQFDAETGLFVPGPTELGSGFELRDASGVVGTADNPAELGEVLGSGESGKACMAALWYRSAKRRDLDPSGADQGNVGQLLRDWEASGNMSLKSLLRTIVASEDFVTLFPPPEE